MKKYSVFAKTIVLITILIFIGASVLPSTASRAIGTCRSETYNFNERTLYVGGSGSGNYSNIQDAIDDANNGDTVFVYSGTYYENVVVDKSIKLVGEDKETTVIDGGKTVDVLKIIEDDVTLSDFTLCDSGSTINDAGVEITSNDNLVQNVDLFNVSYGIWVKSSEKNIMKNNTITAEWDGIWLMKSGNNILKNNSMFNCGFVLDGPSLTYFLQDIDTSNSANNKPVYYYKNLEGIKVPPDAGQVILVNCNTCEISNLKISNVTDCIEIMYSNNNTIRNNSLFNSTDHGIRMFKSNYNIISNNICYNNPAGISFLGITDLGGEEYDIKRANIQGDCRYNILTNNTITQNWNVGVWMFTSDNNFVSKNVFKNNRKDAFFHECKNKWDNNYWNRPRLLPKPIFGLKTGRVIKSIPAVNFDWHPALVPYEP